MITLSSIDELNGAKYAIENIKKDYPVLYKKLVDTINLTRALQFKYNYMGCLIMEKDPAEFKPKSVYSSVLRLYNKELQKLKDDENFKILKQTILNISATDYSKVCQLVLGKTPESLIGSSNIK